MKLQQGSTTVDVNSKRLLVTHVGSAGSTVAEVDANLGRLGMDTLADLKKSGKFLEVNGDDYVYKLTVIY